MNELKWFRLYHEAIDDEKIRLLAFEDRWHFVALLCCKAKGILDDEDADRRERKVALKLGLDRATLDEVARRLSDVGLICRESLNPIAWDERQFVSDNSTERVRKYRDRLKKQDVKRYGNVSVTVQETETDTEKEKEKTARLKAPSDVPIAVWDDFVKVRRQLRAAITPTGLAGIRREAKKAGLSLEDALRICCERSWRGFKAEWVAAKTGFAPSEPEKPWHKSQTGIRAKAIEFGIVEDNFGGDWLAFRAAVYRAGGVTA